MHGWLKTMNNPNQLQSVANPNEKDFFGMALNYDELGNIVSQSFKTAQNKVPTAVGGVFQYIQKDLFSTSYTYDNMNRLKTANMAGTKTFSLGGNSNGIAYDDNGNIKNMTRNWNNTTVDNLGYAYKPNSNTLANIVETATNPAGASEFFKQSSAYTYDANGNMTKDSGKGINSIVYNHLNLPIAITSNTGNYSYTYTATGQKLQSSTPAVGGAVVRDYIAGLVYDQKGLKFIPTAEGRALPVNRIIAPNTTTAGLFYRYEYHLND